jgi:acetyltransferase-like isoleucine patch superfamily enzyme
VYSRIKNKLKHLVKGKTKGNFFISKNPESTIVKGTSVEIINTRISLSGTSQLIIHNNVKLDGYNIRLNNGYFEIGDCSQLVKGAQYLNPDISIDNGKLVIGSHNIIKATLSIRFGGECSIGNYNAINEETELRCDQSLIIGDHNMISYQCMIYDTNTHCIYSPEIRRERTISDFPIIGNETEKPNTKQVIIGNDNWLGKRSTLLKGCVLGNQVIVGANAVASNLQVNKGLVVGNPAYVVTKE